MELKTGISFKQTVTRIFLLICLTIISILLIYHMLTRTGSDESDQRILQVAQTKGLIAFWDFLHTNEEGWISYYDENIYDTGYNVVLRRIGDKQAYTVHSWPYRDEDSKIVIDSAGPFGHAVRFNHGYIFAESPRNTFDQSPLDINGRRPFTLIAWCKFIGRRHFVAGIWDEGGWDKYGGRRQVALFGGLFQSRSVIGHISATGASSYPQSIIQGSQYARKRAIDGKDFEDVQWVAIAMTFDPDTDEVKVYTDGEATRTFITDPVANDVFQYDEPVSSNPYFFPWPIYSPRSFILKFNGYDFQTTGTYEHWVHVDTDHNSITYGRNGKNLSALQQEYQVHFDILREGKSLFSKPLSFLAVNDRSIEWPETVKIQVGDEIVTSLNRMENEDWMQVGSVIHYPIQEGAPFTFGRALGLGNEPIDTGTQLFIDGVAVFNRVLSTQELNDISFLRKK